MSSALGLGLPPAPEVAVASFAYRVVPCEEHYVYDHVYGADTKNTEIFEDLAMSMLRDFFGGRNCCIFTYGWAMRAPFAP